MEKVAITFDWPVRFERITNGERIIAQAGPDEIEVDVCEGEMSSESWIKELPRLFAETEHELRGNNVRKRKRQSSSNSVDE